MPGLLRKSAKCPECGKPIEASFRTSNNNRTVYEYCHTDRSVSCEVRVPKAEEALYERNVYRPLHVISGQELFRQDKVNAR